MKRRLIAFGLILGMVLSIAVSGCAPAGTVAPAAKPAQSEAPAGKVTAEPAAAPKRTVTDGFGRTVELPETVDTIAAIGGAARLITYAGATDKLVGVTDMDKKNQAVMPYTAVNAEKFASLPSVGSGGANDTAYIEQLVALAPDVIIAMQEQDVIENVAEKTGIPTIGVYPKDMFDESFYSAIELVGEVAGTQEHCAQVVGYIKGCKDDLDKRTKDIPDADKPSVYVGAVNFRGTHGFEGSYAGYPPFVAIRAKNVVDETNKVGAFLIDLEQVTVWDPDIIFLTPSNMNLVNEDYAKNKAFYEGLTAVQNGKLYAQIAYNSNWANMEIAIADAYYAGTVVYPEQFADIDPVKKADEIFMTMLGQPFYEKLAASGQRFEKLTIGE